MVGLSLGHRLEQKQEKKQKLSLKQYQKLHFGQFIIKSKAGCPNCGKILSDKQIREGFSDNPFDFNTTCPKCGQRFLANLIIKFEKDSEGKKKKTEKVIFLCSSQTLHQMLEIKKMQNGKIGITYLSKYNRQLFYNIIRHWGTYERGLEILKGYEQERERGGVI